MLSIGHIGTVCFAAALGMFFAAFLEAEGQPQEFTLIQLRFSPDGQYLLAQDASSITILAVEPLRVLFRAPAPETSLAEFTPDSREFVFVSSGVQADSRQVSYSKATPHVERWSIAKRAKLESTRLPALPCATRALSPNGRTLVCVDFQGTLTIIDVPSGTAVFEKKKFGKEYIGGDLEYTWVWGDPGSARVGFSPDSRYLVVLPNLAVGPTLAWDLRERSAVRLSGALKRLRRGYHVAFVAPDRVLISEYALGHTTIKGTLVEFPSGRVLWKSKKMVPGQLFRAADSNFVLIRPFGLNVRDDDPSAKRSAAVEYATGQAIISETPALDIFGNRYVTEIRPGEVGLSERGKGLQASVKLDAQ